MHKLTKKELQMQAQIMQLIKTGECENIELASEILQSVPRIEKTIEPLDGDKYDALFKPLTGAIKQDIIDTVLSSATIEQFKEYKKTYSFYALFRSPVMRHKIASKYPFMQGELWYGIFMEKVFQPYRVDSIEADRLDSEITKLKYWRSLYGKYHPSRHKYAAEHNEKVRQFNALVAPQNLLIKRFNKVLKTKNK